MRCFKLPEPSCTEGHHGRDCSVDPQDALNKIWRVERKSGSFLLRAIRQRFLSFSLVLGTDFLLLLSLVASAALGAVERFMGYPLPWRVFFGNPSIFSSRSV